MLRIDTRSVSVNPLPLTPPLTVFFPSKMGLVEAAGYPSEYLMLPG